MWSIKMERNSTKEERHLEESEGKEAKFHGNQRTLTPKY